LKAKHFRTEKACEQILLRMCDAKVLISHMWYYTHVRNRLHVANISGINRIVHIRCWNSVV